MRSRKEIKPQPEPKREPENKESNYSRGPTASFWKIRGGSKDHANTETLVRTTPSEARVGGAKASGRPTRKCWKEEDRAKVALE